MADFVFNIAKGAYIEQVRDGAANLTFLLLKTDETDATLKDYDDVSAMLAGTPVEADFASYARKTGITGSITVDDTNDWVDLDIPDQTFTAATAGQSLVAAIVAYQDGAGDANLKPVSNHDITVTTDGNDLVFQIHANGICRTT